MHRARALAVLANNPACRWLVHKTEILDELGRIESDYAMLIIAKRICELKPATAEAVEMVRRHREFDQLADEIAHVVNDYRKRNPDTTRQEVLQALETAGMLLNRTTDRGVPGSHQFLRKAEAATPAGISEKDECVQGQA